MTVWIVAADCGNNYCGCANHALNESVGSHLVGIYTSEEAAIEAVAKAEAAEHTFSSHPDPRTARSTWASVAMREVETDVMPAAFEVWG